ncbi:ABC transporter substrate-binding protein [Erwinia sp. JUb26]|uniref:ABC transporter substrate-binding protein n=1 Tax=Erwinia sp. JUb26 TaxID=2485126 RepID=UPI000F4A5825|nr:ABC transporter substrate-binding protein [Erwinia sp. JUb26]ROR09947.1 iron complex transport system substrate-binding protein [Erwinia sp. JUb26]
MPEFSRRGCLKMLLMLPLAARAGLPVMDPHRIVAINWAAAETLLSIGVTPLAISDTGYFRRRIPQPALPAGVQDIGPFWEPNMELLDALGPSLILSDVLSAPVMAKMAAIAPLETVTAWYASGNPWQALHDWTQQTGARLGAEAAAARWLQQVEEELNDLRLRLAARQQARVLVMVLDQDGRYATIYGRGSLADAVIRQLGLRNAWQKAVNAAHIARVRIEELADLPCDRLFYTELPTVMTRLRRARQPDGLWQQLPLFKSDRVTHLDRFFPFGGLATGLALAGDMTRALEAEQ